MRKLNLLRLWLTFLLLFACYPAALAQTPTTAHAPALPPAEVQAAERITAARLSERLYYVASDEMDGRDTPSPGLDATAKFIAGNPGPPRRHAGRRSARQGRRGLGRPRDLRADARRARRDPDSGRARLERLVEQASECA